MKIYNVPKLEVVELRIEERIASSGCNCSGTEAFNGMGPDTCALIPFVNYDIS